MIVIAFTLFYYYKNGKATISTAGAIGSQPFSRAFSSSNFNFLRSFIFSDLVFALFGSIDRPSLLALYSRRRWPLK